MTTVESIVEFLEHKYQPADNIGEADIQMNHSELCSHLRNFFPGFEDEDEALLKSEELFKAMKEAGYKYDDVNMEFFWMFRKADQKA